MVWTSFEPAIAILLATIAPTMALISINIDFFSMRQMRNSLLLISGIGACLSTVYFVLNYVYLHPLSVELFGPKNPTVELIACILSLTILFVFSERTIYELIPTPKARLLTISSVYVFFSVATYFISISTLSAVLFLYIAISAYDFYKNLKIAHATSEKSSKKHKNMDDYDAEFKHKPNVYVLFLESLHSSDALKALYDIDNTELCDSLTDDGFTLYEDVYSNHTNTVYSFSSLVCPNYLYNPEIITKTSQQPKSKVLSAFESNGYSLNLFSEDFLKVRFSYLFDYYESESSAIGVNIHRMFAPILSQSVLIRKMFFAKDFFESITQFDKLYEELRSKIISSGPQPQFNWFHFGACHSPYHPWDTLTGFEDQYKASYITAKSQIQKTVSMIKELDSDPLIIAIGDHGAHLYRYVEDKDGKNPNEVMRARGFEPELIAKDFFSVFLGIHWPVSHYTAGETISHVRVFAHVISALSEDKRHLNDMMPNVSFSGNRAYGQTIAVRDGVPLKDWEPASKSNLASFLVKETQNNPNDISVHISLLDHYFGVGEWQNGADYALDLCNKFPSSEVIHTEASRRMIMLKEIKMATRLAHKALQINPRSGAAYCNLALAADMEGKVTEHDFFIKKTFEYDEDFLFDRNAYLRYGAALLRSGEHEQLNIFYDRLDSLGQVHFKYFIDWQMQYRSYVTSGNTQVVQWLDECINNSMSLGLKIAMLTKKIVICIKDENWEEVTKTARTLIEVKKENLGAYIVLSYSLERAGMIDEALQTLLTGYRTTKESVLLEHLGAYANRQRIHHPSLAEIKVTAKEVMKERAAHLEKAALFDATWYATEYGDLLGKMSPVDHYLNYSIALMLNPNGGFDAGYYYGNQTDVFAGAADASLHFAQFGKVDEARPYMTCLFDPTLAINTSWQAERSHATATQ